MGKLFFYFIISFLLFSCTDKEVIPEKDESQEEENGDAGSKKLLEKLNLDFPGLEKVKEAYADGRTEDAYVYLLDYYRNRDGVNNIYVNLINPSQSAFDRNVADQALQHRFYAKNYCESIDPATDKEIYYSFEDADGEICWELDVDNLDSQFYPQLYLHQWMEPLAVAYYITKNEDYMLAWKESYSSWMESYPNTGKYDGKQWGGLQIAGRISSQINIMEYTVNSVNFTPEWLEYFLTNFEDHIEYMRKDYYPEGNILISQIYSIISAAVLMPEFKNSEVWLKEGLRMLEEEMAVQILPDGVQNELDMSYHVGVVWKILDIYDLLNANGKSSLLSANHLQRLKNSTDFLKDIIYPDYSWECFNDTRATTKNVLLRYFERYSATFPDDEEMKWMATEGESGKRPEYTSKAYPDAGYYVLRSGWEKKDAMMIVKNNYNPDNKWHCQPDNGTFSVYVNGRCFFPDAGVYAYGGTLREDYRATPNHNTLTVDGKTIDATHQKGKLLNLYTTDDGKTDVLVTLNESYDGLFHRRAVLHVDRMFFVVVDEAFSSYEPTEVLPVELNFHLLTDANKPTKVILPESNGADAVKAYTCFTDGNNIYTSTFIENITGINAGDVKVSTTDSDFSTEYNKVNGKRSGYKVSVLKRGKKLRFITVIYPCSNGESVADVNAEFTSGTNETPVELKVNVGNKEYNLMYNIN